MSVKVQQNSLCFVPAGDIHGGRSSRMKKRLWQRNVSSQCSPGLPVGCSHPIFNTEELLYRYWYPVHSTHECMFFNTVMYSGHVK